MSITSLDDLRFRIRFQQLLSSQREYALAELRRDEDLVAKAGRVSVRFRSQFVTVQELYLRACQGHHSSVYEQWAMETQRRVRETVRALPLVAGQALLTYANAQDEMSVTADECSAALADAQHALYGQH